MRLRILCLLLLLLLASPALAEEWTGNDNCEAEICTPQPAGSIRFEADPELRDRLLRVMARRVAQDVPRPAPYLQKLYDSTLLCFFEAAKAHWPELDTSALERCAAFDSDDERRQLMQLVRELIGDTVVNKPEDITYWVNRETLQDLWK